MSGNCKVIAELGNVDTVEDKGNWLKNGPKSCKRSSFENNFCIVWGSEFEAKLPCLSCVEVWNSILVS